MFEKALVVLLVVFSLALVVKPPFTSYHKAETSIEVESFDISKGAVFTFSQDCEIVDKGEFVEVHCIG